METYLKRLLIKYDINHNDNIKSDFGNTDKFKNDLVTKKIFGSHWFELCLTKTRLVLQSNTYINYKKRYFCIDLISLIKIQIFEDYKTGKLLKDLYYEKLNRFWYICHDLTDKIFVPAIKKSARLEILGLIDEYLVPMISGYKKDTEDLDEYDLSISEERDLQKTYRHRPFCARCDQPTEISCLTCDQLGYCGLICMTMHRSEHGLVCGKNKHD